MSPYSLEPPERDILMKIIKACQLPGEAALLHAAIADFSITGPRSHYADWLAAKGDAGRAHTVRATIKAYHAIRSDELADVSGDAAWLSMVGVPILRAFIESAADYPRSEMESFRDLVFAKLCPALSLTCSAMERDPDIGASHMWGLPDLPEDQIWPKVAEVSNWFDAKEQLPPENHCAFLGQFSFRDLSETVFGQELPSSGGFSVFTIAEVEELGIVETVIRPWDNAQSSTRREAPVDLIEDKLGDQTNAPAPPEAIELTETLSLPDASWGPFGNAIPNCQWGEPHHDLYYELMDVCSPHKMGFGGYLRATSGADPSPDINARRFAVLPTRPDTGTLHFSIPAGDLKAGKLDRVQYVWNDWDS